MNNNEKERPVHVHVFPLQVFEAEIKVSVIEMHRCETQREFRALLAGKFESVYQEALAEWERLHPEAEG